MQHIFRVKNGILNNFIIYLQLSSEISLRTSLIYLSSDAIQFFRSLEIVKSFNNIHDI